MQDGWSLRGTEGRTSSWWLAEHMGSRGLLGREDEEDTSLEDVLRSNGEDSIRDIDVAPQRTGVGRISRAGQHDCGWT